MTQCSLDIWASVAQKQLFNVDFIGKDSTPIF